MLDLVLASIGSFRGWISCISGGLVESMRDMMRLAIGSCSPLELTATWVFFGIVSGFCCNTPLEVIILFFSCPALELGVGYCTGADACLGRAGVGCVEFMLDMVRLEIGSWSPLDLTATWVFFGIVSGFCCNTPLEVIILFFLVQPWNLVVE